MVPQQMDLFVMLSLCNKGLGNVYDNLPLLKLCNFKFCADTVWVLPLKTEKSVLKTC